VYWCYGVSGEEEYQSCGVLAEGIPELITEGLCVRVLAPAHKLILRGVDASGYSRRVHPRTLAFQFEDELLEDSEMLQWVCTGRHGREYGLAGYREEDMSFWRSLAEPYGLSVNAVVPDVLTIPPERGDRSIPWQQHRICRTGMWTGFSVPSSWALDSLANTAEEPGGRDDFYSWLWCLGCHAGSKHINLLRGSRTTSLFSLKALQKYSGIAGAFLLLGALGMGCGAQYLQAASVHAQTEQVWHTLYPDEAMGTSPVSQTRERIRFLEENMPSGHSFLELLMQARESMPSDVMRPGKLNFNADTVTLTMDLSSPELKTFSQVNEEGNRVSLNVVSQGNGQLSVSGE
jgi:type II secretion system protein L